MTQPERSDSQHPQFDLYVKPWIDQEEETHVSLDLSEALAMIQARAMMLGPGRRLQLTLYAVSR